MYHGNDSTTVYRFKQKDISQIKKKEQDLNETISVTQSQTSFKFVPFQANIPIHPRMV